MPKVNRATMEAPPVCRRVAIYLSEDGRTVDIPLPRGTNAREWVALGGVMWHRQATLELQDGETVEQALARHIAEHDTEIAALAAEAV